MKLKEGKDEHDLDDDSCLSMTIQQCLDHCAMLPVAVEAEEEPPCCQIVRAVRHGPIPLKGKVLYMDKGISGDTGINHSFCRCPRRIVISRQLSDIPVRKRRCRRRVVSRVGRHFIDHVCITRYY